MYAANEDWLRNNVKFWKMKVENPDPEAPYGQDGRWRWMVVDMDSGFINYQKNMISLTSLNRDYTLIIHSLISNPHYRNEFINRFADFLNTVFLPSRVKKEIDTIESHLEVDIEKQIARYNTMNNSVNQWHSNVDLLRKFAEKRPAYVREHILEEFGLNGTFQIKINTNSTRGHVRINSIDISRETPGVEDPNTWSGIYFIGVPISLTAIPQPGYHFSHWEGIDPTIAQDESISIILENDLEITAVFEASKPD
jgi:hypothetical protein